jgi:hypothetical protein
MVGDVGRESVRVLRFVCMWECVYVLLAFGGQRYCFFSNCSF